jgi:hypothetical protein
VVRPDRKDEAASHDLRTQESAVERATKNAKTGAVQRRALGGVPSWRSLNRVPGVLMAQCCAVTGSLGR